MRSGLLFILLCGCLYGQQAGVEGIAVDSITHQPMPRVHITLRPVTADGPNAEVIYGAISKPDGHFSIAGMKPGIYFVSAQRNGYFHMAGKSQAGRSQADKNQKERLDTSVTLHDGEQINDFTVEMTPRGVIAGRLTDEFGDPVQQVNVEAVAAIAGSPESKVPVEMNTSTDERGQYRLILPPGKFYVKTTAESMRMFSVFDESVYGTTWYPQAGRKEQADAVEIKPGQEALAIDIRLVPKRSLKISGVVTGLKDNTAGASILLFSNPEGFSLTSAAEAQPDGTFTIRGLTPGHYRLMAKQTLAGKTLQSEVADFQLGSSDETGVSLALIPGQTLSGNLEIEGDAAKTLTEKLTIRVEAYSPHEGGRPTGSDVGQDGSFQIAEVFPEKFRVKVAGLPENAYIKKVRAGGVESPDAVLDLSSGVDGARIHVTISRNGGQLEGSVTGDDGEPLRSPIAFVCLASTPADLGGGDFKPVKAGEKFTYHGLRPGRYRLIAVDGQQFTGEFDDPAAAFRIAAEIEIHEGDRITKDAKVIDVAAR
ncbi:MAG TPA: carboxypeptidase-like regulatory domain-containing protein [Bryobacteraceae bacterium]|jgi:hypothetical protein|nr:carboxypeptidase-like regulatory domain-containing protein [Bryobacteraceae bacterium]